jgi:S-methylmethionine-dependent homocysteine/selenocysteine methylase
VAGGLAPLEDCYRPDLVPDEDTCLAEHRRQAALLAGLGVDLIFIETMNSAREARAALRAARDTGLPILLSLCPRPPAHLLSGEPLEAVVPDLARAGGPGLAGLLLNCATPEALAEIFPRFAPLAPGLPHGLYAHLGEPDERTGWRLPERHEPERYAAWMRDRIAGGARLVGGCCGTTPDHIAALAALLP